MNTEDNNPDYEVVITNSAENGNTTSNSEIKESGVEQTFDEKNNKSEKRKNNIDEDKIEKKLWNIAKKYKTFFDKGEVPQIQESEDDRGEIAEAYTELSTKRHWQLDARAYQSLTKMQRTRDAKIALEGTSEKERLRMIAWEVKTRVQPIVFIPGDSTIGMDIFNAHSNNNIRIIEGNSQELLVEDEIIEGKGIAIIENLPLRKLSKNQKEKLKREVLTKFNGAIMTKAEFEKNLDSLYADMISLMVREGIITVLKVAKDKFKILAIENLTEEYSDSDLESQSLAITPMKDKNKEN